MAILTTESLTIGYRSTRRQEHVIAHDLHLQVEAGQMVCLLGANGIGKSTLLRTLTAMQVPLSGDVFLNGVNVHQMKADERARTLSIVTTERPNMGMLSGWELVALGRHPYTDWSGRLSKDDERAVDEALHAISGQDLANAPVMELSDGQRQKLMIARAVAQGSQMMLLDEPTAFLDLPRRVEVMRLLQNLAHQVGRAVLLSTHDFDLALRLADVLWLMGEGGAIQQGAPEDLALADTFADIFTGDGVRWHSETGTFVVEEMQRGRAMLAGGTNLQRIWTKRALARIGYEVVEPCASQEDMIVVSIFEADGMAYWSVQGHVYANLETLTADMRDWAS